MKQLKRQFRDNRIVEKGLLARLIHHPEERGTIALIIEREDFETHVHGRLFAAMMLWPSGETDSLASEMFEMFRYVGDNEAAEALIELSMSPYPDSFAELIWLAIHLHDEANCRDNIRLEDEARARLINEECERLDFLQTDDDLEW